MKVFASTTLYRQTDRERVSFSPVTKQHKKLKQTYYYKIQLSSTKGCTVIQSYLYPQLNSSTSTQQHQPQHTHSNINHNIHTTISTTTYTQQHQPQHTHNNINHNIYTAIRYRNLLYSLYMESEVVFLPNT